MTPAERRMVRLVQERTRKLDPAMRRAWLRAVAILQESLSAGQVADLIASGRYDAIFSAETLDRAFIPVRDQLYDGLRDGFRLTAADIKGATVRGAPSISFNVLSERVRTAIRTLDTQILATAKAEVREVVRQAVAAGLEAGQHPRTVARGIREVVGLSPQQASFVRNYRAALMGEEGRSIKSYTLRDKRFDRSVAKGNLTTEQVDKMVASYERKMRAHHAETISRTASLNTYRQAQQASYASAIEQGIVDPARAQSTWVTVGDARVRDSHDALNGMTVPFGSAFPGQGVVPAEWNCRCLLRHSMRPL